MYFVWGIRTPYIFPKGKTYGVSFDQKPLQYFIINFRILPRTAHFSPTMQENPSRRIFKRLKLNLGSFCISSRKFSFYHFGDFYKFSFIIRYRKIYL